MFNISWVKSDVTLLELVQQILNESHNVNDWNVKKIALPHKYTCIEKCVLLSAYTL